MKPISIITPHFNSLTFIDSLQGSLMKQDHELFEWIVVDDGSTDESFAALEKQLSSQNVADKLLRIPHLGACAARNAGLVHSTGKWVTFLDSDDYYENGAISGLARHVISSDKSVIHAMPFILLRESNQAETLIRKPLLPGTSPCSLLDHIQTTHLHHSGCLFPREIFASVGLWNELLAADQDGELLYRISLAGYKFVQHPGPGIVVRDHGRHDRITRAQNTNTLASRLFTTGWLLECLSEDDLLTSSKRRYLRRRFLNIWTMACFQASPLRRVALYEAKRLSRFPLSLILSLLQSKVGESIYCILYSAARRNRLKRRGL